MQDQHFFLIKFELSRFSAEKLSTTVILWIMQELATDFKDVLDSENPLQTLKVTPIDIESIVLERNDDASVYDKLFFKQKYSNHLLPPNLLNKKMADLGNLLLTLLRDWLVIKYHETIKKEAINQTNIFDYSAPFFEMNTPWKNALESPVEILYQTFLILKDSAQKSKSLSEFSAAMSLFIQQLSHIRSIFDHQRQLEDLETKISQTLEGLTPEVHAQLNYGIGKMLLGKTIKEMRKDQIKSFIDTKKTQIRNVFYYVNYCINKLEDFIPKNALESISFSIRVPRFFDFKGNAQTFLFFQDSGAPSDNFSSVFTLARLESYSSVENIEIYLPSLPLKKKQKIALKIQHRFAGRLEPDFQDSVEKEAETLYELGKLVFRVEFSADQDTAYIPMKYAGSYNMLERLKLKEMTEPRIQLTVLFYLTKELKKIHEKKIAHQNLKPSNIMLSKKGTCKIVNFESSIKVTKASHDSIYLYEGCTPLYAMDNPTNQTLSIFRQDIFALGVVFLTVLFNKPFIENRYATGLVSDFETGLISYLLGDRIGNNINWKITPKLPNDINLQDYPVEIKAISNFIYDTMLHLHPSQNDAKDYKIISHVFEFIKKQCLLYTLNTLNVITNFINNKEDEIYRTLDRLKAQINPKSTQLATQWFETEIKDLFKEKNWISYDAAFIDFLIWDKAPEDLKKFSHKKIPPIINSVIPNKDSNESEKLERNPLNHSRQHPFENWILLNSTKRNSRIRLKEKHAKTGKKGTLKEYFQNQENEMKKLCEALLAEKPLDENSFFSKKTNSHETENTGQMAKAARLGGGQ